MATDGEKKVTRFQKSYFDVLGLCCSSEIPLIEKILKPLEGVQKVSVIVPSRTVIVVHDNLLVSQTQIVKVLNQARLEANIQVFGEEKKGKSWPNRYALASLFLLVISAFQSLYRPLHWFALAAAIVGLPPIVMRSLTAIWRLTLDINILVLIAVSGSLLLRDFWEAGLLVFLFTFAVWLESRASHKATAAMSSLMSMAPQKAVLAENGVIVDAKDVKVDTILAVKAGEVIPIDGIVVGGKSEVDEKSLTGESFPVAKQVDSAVWAGTINLTGYISVKTTTVAEETAVAKMAKLVEEAQSSKSKTQRLIDSCAKYYTPTVLFIALGVAVVPVAMRVHDLRHWFHLALVFLVSACPCALVLSTPVATYCALTKAATFGLLVKGGDYLEALAKIKVIAFDKTGTLTKGEFSVTEFQNCHNVSKETLLYWVSSIESKSSHPMAAALVEYSRSNGVEPKPEDVKEFEIFPGEGIYGEIEGKSIYIGSKRIARRAGCSSVPAMEGTTIGYVFLESTPVGIFSLSDTCRTGVAEAIRELKSLGLKTAMLTGDSNAAAMYIQHKLGQAIETVHAELLPEEKVAFIKELKKKAGPTAMVGDGINDAPALATADIGISMGISGSAVAIETGHVTLMSNDIRKIALAVRLSRETRRRIIENVIVSIVTKVAILALALAGHPLVWAALVADVGTCLLVIFNSMRLRRGASTVADVKKKNNCFRKTTQGRSHGHGHGHCHQDGFGDEHSKSHAHKSHSSCNGGSRHEDHGCGRDSQAELGCHAHDHGCGGDSPAEPKCIGATIDVELGLTETADEAHADCSSHETNANHGHSSDDITHDHSPCSCARSQHSHEGEGREEHSIIISGDIESGKVCSEV
ncbi:putative inactive cadmium/zinc-transporting ATPase HMA3 [Aristolochia californica]|uniref:putative inactive cadmium/zinc-transporting ATPase HMA3 n=1 Tax=Aristolochia californica TaxID=171875 RepID=UPI0035E075E0